MKLISKSKEEGLYRIYSVHGEIVKAYSSGLLTLVSKDGKAEEVKFESGKPNEKYILQPFGNSIVKRVDETFYLYWKGDFLKMPVEGEYDTMVVYDNNNYVAYFSEDCTIKAVCVCDGVAHQVTIQYDDFLRCSKVAPNVIVWGEVSGRALLFCTKSGERLWEYKEDCKELKINIRCIPIVGNVVVVISVRGGTTERIQGFNVCTGEKLWEVSNKVMIRPSTLLEGEDHLLYGCYTDDLDYDKPSRLMLTILNPANGDIENVQVGEACDVMAYRVAMYGRMLYYSDNRRGNEVGVIDVDKRTVVDRVSLYPKTRKAVVTLLPPVVTDDRVYVCGQNWSFWVFEK